MDLLRDGIRLLPGWHALLGPPERDLVRFALAVIAADRLAPRSVAGDRALDRELGWTREINLSVALENPEKLGAAKSHFESVLGFMTDDVWHLAFESEHVPPCQQGSLFGDEEKPVGAEVCLFSGGLDSAAGLLARHRAGAGPFVAVSASGNAVRTATQADVIRLLRELGAEVRWVRVPTSLEAAEMPRTPEETTQRSRGFLFLMLGAAIALAVRADRVVAYESGVGALNLPLAASQAGAQTTRAMHPGAFCLLEDALAAAGCPVRFDLPFLLQTKGEVCGAAGSALAQLAALAVSCDEGDGHKPDPAIHCGLCTSCLFRRVALHACLGGADATEYRDYETRRHGLYDLTMFETQVHTLCRTPLTLKRLLELDAEVRWAARLIDRRESGQAAGDLIASLFQRYSVEADAFLRGTCRPFLKPHPRATTRRESGCDLFAAAR
jgi:7-cyano-7-deazaguanine synthase in queuosine biosynthesis